MNTGDYCPRGRELYEQFEKCYYTHQKFGRIHMLFLASDAELKYRQHVDTCEQCNSYKDNTNK